MSGKSDNLPPDQTAKAEHGETQTAAPLRCHLTGEVISNPDDAYWAPPLVTVQDLFGTIFNTLKTNPGNLGSVLFAEQPDVPYAPEAREKLGQRRTVEQLKFIGMVLVIAAIIIVPLLLLLS